MSIVAKCCQQSTEDRCLSITLSVQLCAQHDDDGCEATRRVVRWCQPSLVVCVLIMTLARSGLKVEVTGQGLELELGLGLSID